MTAREEFQAELVTLLVEILSTLQDVRTEIFRLNSEILESVHGDVSRETHRQAGSFHASMSHAPLPEATVMRSGETVYVRQPLRDNHALLGKLTAEGRMVDLRVELPTGDRVSITEDEAIAVFGPIRLPNHLIPARHPADRALNPEQS